MHKFTSTILASAGVVASLLLATAGQASVLYDSPASGYAAGSDRISGMSSLANRAGPESCASPSVTAAAKR